MSAQMGMGMTGPSWLAGIFGAIMLAAAAYAVGRLLVAWRGGRTTDYEVDAHHALMGVSMAGMLVPGLAIVTAGRATIVWIIVWTLVTLWFAISVIRCANKGGPGSRFTGHHLPHLIMSGAMLYMLADSLRPAASTGRGVGMSAMGSSAALMPWPTIDALFVVFMAGYAVIVVDRLPQLAVVGFGHVGRSDTEPRKLLAPRMAGVENLGMAITMGYMLTMMFV